ncbi:hypothetical protein SLEP1_g52974 [Rubroshorea leprosula]|uniref:RRM domain-containing protein n=1 Tax=Rubroshorea leprosula TaxID=152421 RepID=A0AAV5M850_9ROSI|nr:hypothetical protein SLEP1_g52974 [Rubroshorea leprosula]
MRFKQRDNSKGYDKGILKQATSFFIANFPESWKIEDMWKEFKKYGRVIQIYVANKKDKWDRKFGFVRYLEIKNPREMELNLSKIKVGELRIQANLAMYNEGNGTTGRSRRQIVHRGESSYGQYADVAAKSFADVVRGDKHEPRMEVSERKRWTPKKNVRTDVASKETDVVLEFQANKEEKEWLKNFYVGQMHKLDGLIY